MQKLIRQMRCNWASPHFRGLGNDTEFCNLHDPAGRPPLTYKKAHKITYELVDRLHVGRAVRVPGDRIASVVSTWLAELGADSPSGSMDNSCYPRSSTAYCTVLQTFPASSVWSPCIWAAFAIDVTLDRWAAKT
jgi:hypothetical protein